MRKKHQKSLPEREKNNLFNTGVIESVAATLLRRKETIAVAESVTAGFVQAALSSATDAIQFFQGGITTYNIGQKSRHLHIDPVHALSCNCVSQQVADQMALEVCHLFSGHWGLAITGYASAVPESGNRLFAFFSIACGGKIVLSGKLTPPDNTPLQVQLWYTNELLAGLEASLKK
jgi:PncC family amidohydrolase